MAGRAARHGDGGRHRLAQILHIHGLQAHTKREQPSAPASVQTSTTREKKALLWHHIATWKMHKWAAAESDGGMATLLLLCTSGGLTLCPAQPRQAQQTDRSFLMPLTAMQVTINAPPREAAQQPTSSGSELSDAGSELTEARRSMLAPSGPALEGPARALSGSCAPRCPASGMSAKPVMYFLNSWLVETRIWCIWLVMSPSAPPVEPVRSVRSMRQHNRRSLDAAQPHCWP